MFNKKLKEEIETLTARLKAVEAAWTETHNFVTDTKKILTDEIKTVDTKISAEVADVRHIAETKVKRYEDKMEEFVAHKELEDGADPFLEIVSESFDPENGIRLQLNWNEAMINFLKRNGYIGVNEDEIIEKYIYDLFKEKALEVNKQ